MLSRLSLRALREAAIGILILPVSAPATESVVHVQLRLSRGLARARGRGARGGRGGRDACFVCVKLRTVGPAAVGSQAEGGMPRKSARASVVPDRGDGAPDAVQGVQGPLVFICVACKSIVRSRPPAPP